MVEIHYLLSGLQRVRMCLAWQNGLQHRRIHFVVTEWITTWQNVFHLAEFLQRVRIYFDVAEWITTWQNVFRRGRKDYNVAEFCSLGRKDYNVVEWITTWQNVFRCGRMN